MWALYDPLPRKLQNKSTLINRLGDAVRDINSNLCRCLEKMRFFVDITGNISKDGFGNDDDI